MLSSLTTLCLSIRVSRHRDRQTDRFRERRQREKVRESERESNVVKFDDFIFVNPGE
jgi:hypothetical protein